MTNPNNPQLQRAAPELLAMLKDILRAQDLGIEPPMAEHRLMRIEALIAKAEGWEP